MPTKTLPERQAKKRVRHPIPKSADRAVIGGKEFLLIPSDDFAEWYEDQILAAVAAERLRLERRHAIPADVFLAKYKRAKQGKAK